MPSPSATTFWNRPAPRVVKRQLTMPNPPVDLTSPTLAASMRVPMMPPAPMTEMLSMLALGETTLKSPHSVAAVKSVPVPVWLLVRPEERKV